MSHRLRIMSWVVTFILLFSVISGCANTDKGKASENAPAAGAQNDKSGSAGPEPITLPISQKPITMTYWTNFHVNVAKSMKSFNEHEVIKELEKRTNVKFEFIHPAQGQEKEQLNLAIASGDLPDVIRNNFEGYRGGPDGAIDDGILIDMNNLINKYAPNFLNIVKSNPDFKKLVTSDKGKYISFGATFFPPEMINYSNRGPVVRKDYLDSVGLPVPETIDEWYTMLKAFKEKKNVEVPLAIGSIFEGVFKETYAFASAYGVSISGFYQDNGKAKFGQLQPGYKDFVTTLNKWYKEGLINKDFATHKHVQNIQPMILDGRGGSAVVHLGQIRSWPELSKDKNLKLVPAPYPSLKKGESPKFRTNAYGVNPNPIFISKNCKYPVEVVKYIDYIYGPEGHELTTWGVAEGRTYIKENGKHKFTDLIMKNPEGLIYDYALAKYTLNNLVQRWDWELQEPQYNLPEQKSAAWDIWKKASYENVIPPATYLSEEESRRYATIMAEITPYAEEMTLKFIIGIEPIEKFNEYVQKIKAMNIEEAEKIQQASLDRYNKR